MNALHALYRFFDAEGVLLYIGITADVPTRFQSHRDNKPWWGDVARIAIEQFPDRPSVLAAERRAIKAEMPKWNIQHNRPKRVAAHAHVAGRRASILRCSGCQRSVGDSSKTDAVVHVNMHDVRRYEVEYRDWERSQGSKPCPCCAKQAIYLPTLDRTYHEDGSSNDRCWARLLSDTSGIAFRASHMYKSLGNLLDLPDPASWRIHCDDCNPHYDIDTDTYCGDCYWFHASRCSNAEDLVGWTAHLMEKGWLASTNWSDFIRSLVKADA